MDGHPKPPLPERPDLDVKPRGSFSPLVWFVLSGVILVLATTCVVIPFFRPLTILGLVLFGVIALQYLLWGRLFERIYRSGPVDGDVPGEK